MCDSARVCSCVFPPPHSHAYTQGMYVLQDLNFQWLRFTCAAAGVDTTQRIESVVNAEISTTMPQCTCCLLRAACCVLRAACCVLRAACCVLIDDLVRAN